ncbi:chemotaxis protein CheW [Jatrophihabitans telluris]|uniref:Chemotaxis protein CheW n=1 Tax=Jatrophihabitans telluris TaxID=2038343 RepID=A0ABY4R2V6_9ACTN|nr:chemotaxis protein CheW [Jatrophihabitans telluris]UQX89586.1 chemotaxis protein CheW [Jatrophihabitans telluris]
MVQLATFFLGDHQCAVGVEHVQEVLLDQPRTRVPGAPEAVAGLINLRGQVVTALDLRVRLKLSPLSENGSSMNVVVRNGDEVWSLLVDRIGDVIEVPDSQFEPPPDTLTGRLRELIIGAYKLDGHLLLVLDVARVLDLASVGSAASAAA